MALVTYKTDTVLGVTRALQAPSLIGFDSPYTATPHPGTAKTIAGWKWDERTWASDPELEAQDFAPNVWDPDNAAVDSESFQSGVGDNLDLHVNEIVVANVDNANKWAPEVEHGYFYDFSQESYLMSDGGTWEIMSNNISAGYERHLLQRKPKPETPFLLRKYKWNSAEGKYDFVYNLRKKASFTGERDINGIRLPTRDGNGLIIFANIDETMQEFVIEPGENVGQAVGALVAISNKVYKETHGTAPGVSLADMENMGISTGADGEEFHFLYSPILPTPTIVTFATTAGPYTTWTVVTEITGPGQVLVDYDLGVARFGTGAGFHPSSGETVAAYYDSSLALEYEVEHTPDTIIASELNVNPIDRTSARGFLFLKDRLIEPDSIVLSAEAPLLSPDFYGPSFLGTGTKLKATVLSKSGDAVDGVTVTFTILNNIGQFSGSGLTVQGITNSSGIAKTTFSSARDVQTLGAFSCTHTHPPACPSVANSGGNTVITLNTTSLTGNPTEWYVYKVFNDDPSLGIDSLSDYYTNYFSQEGISGPTADVPVDPEDSWEHSHRLLLGLLTPTLYNFNIRNGKKQVLVTWDPNAINPHNNPWDASLGTGAFVPVRPESVVFSGTQTIVTLDGTHPVPGSAGNETLASYFIVGPTVATIQASVYNERLGTTINSNKIQLEVRVPASMDGTILIQALNELEKQELLGVDLEDPPLTGTLPLGFRVKGFGVNLAACVDGLTYYDVNRTLHDTSDPTKTGTNVLAHAFTVRDTGGS